MRGFHMQQPGLSPLWRSYDCRTLERNSNISPAEKKLRPDCLSVPWQLMLPEFDTNCSFRKSPMQLCDGPFQLFLPQNAVILVVFCARTSRPRSWGRSGLCCSLSSVHVDCKKRLLPSALKVTASGFDVREHGFTLFPHLPRNACQETLRAKKAQ